MKLIALLAVLLPFVGGCSVTQYSDAQGRRFYTSTFLQDRKIGEVHHQHNADGSEKFDLTGLDQKSKTEVVEALLRFLATP